MNKNIFVLSFLIVVFGCNDANENSEAPAATVNNLPAASNDSFETTYEKKLQVPAGFYLDTITEHNKKVDGIFTLIRPRLKGKEFYNIDKILLKELERRSKEDTAGRDDDEKDTEEVIGWRETIEPIHIYNSGNITSYAFIDAYSDAGSGRPVRKYLSINFDNRRGKLIRLGDYFKTATKQDSLLLTYIIYAAVGLTGDKYFSAWKEYGFDNSFDFAIDDNKVYFYFDQFSAGNNPFGLAGSVKKKYINYLIKNEYQ